MAVESRTAELFTRLYAKAKPFEPTAYFDPEMDQLLYLTSNAAYRAERVDSRLTILWDAHELRIVGIKLKGFRSLFDELKAEGLVEESRFLPLCKAISMLMERMVADQVPRRGVGAPVPGQARREA
jgi:hypothetical protein